MKKPKFKKRYVLGVGYPVWTDPYNGFPRGIALYLRNYATAKLLKLPKEFRLAPYPKYRLVLERIK